MAFRRPHSWESPAEYRAAMKAENPESENAAPAAAPNVSADTGFEAQKAKVAAQHGHWGAGADKRAVNLDTAAEDADAENATHKALKGGVKALDLSAVKAADKDKEWSKMTPEQQQAAARGSKPAGVAHSTSTPGGSGQTSMGAALAKAGISAPAAEPKAEVKRTPAPAPSPEVAARNNMGAPRVQDNGASVVAGRTVDPNEAAAARRAAGMGAKKNGGVPEKAARPAPVAAATTPRAAASSQQMSKVPGGRFANPMTAASTAMLSHAASTPAQPTMSHLSARPATPVAPSAPAAAPTVAPAANPAPHSPTPATAQPSGGGINASRFNPAAQAAAPVKGEALGFGTPKMGREITYGVAKTSGPTAATRNSYNKHLAEGGNTESYWTARDAKKASRGAASKPAPAAVVETPSVAAPKTEAPIHATAPALAVAPAPVASAPSRPATPKADTTTRAPKTETPAPAAPAALPTMNPVQAQAASSGSVPAPQARASGRVSAPSEPNPGTRLAAGRSGVSGGEHSINVGGDNHGSIVQNHNTYNVNYGHVGGSQGNVDHGYAPRGGSGGGSGGGRAPHERQEQHGAHAHADVWVKDSSGKHSLHETHERLTGKVGGSGERLGKKSGGTQKPIAGSARASGASTPTNPTGTGTTNNWQGPANAGVQHPASGIGTANHGKTTP